MNINYDYYKVFYYAAKYRSITKAAEILMNNQPNITRAIKNLEGELGCTLFERSNKGVTLTPEGEILYSHIAIAVENIVAGEEKLIADRSLCGGSVCVGASETALHGVLLPVLNCFHKTYPNVKIRISNHSTPQALSALKNGLVDIAVVTTPTTDDKTFIERKIKPFSERVICAGDYMRLCGRKLSLEELCEYPIISLSEETKTFEFYSDFFLSHGIVLKPAMEAATADQILPLVKSNLGIGLIPEFFADEAIADGSVAELTLDAVIPQRGIVLVKRSEKMLSAAAKKLEEMIFKI